MKWTILATLLSLTLLSDSLSAALMVETFDSDPVLAPTQAPDVWYVDRYAPAIFASVADPTGNPGLTGGKVLHHGIRIADGLNNRPVAFNTGFYNSQGRSFLLPVSGPGTVWSADLFVPSAWDSTDRRMAGLWGIGKDAGDAQSAFPIIEFASDLSDTNADGTDGHFQYWDTDTGFIDIGLPSDFVYDEWYTFKVTYVGATFELELVAATGTSTDVLTFSDVDMESTVLVENIILQGHNTDDGVDYDIYWDNVTTVALPPVVPEPSTLSLAGIICAAALAARRRRRRA